MWRTRSGISRAEGLGSAKKELIPIEGDARVPMAQVHRLFAGEATPQDVVSAAQSAPAATPAGEPRFYANLYLGLYYEATGDLVRAREHILKAAERFKENGYMGDVARVHAGKLPVRKPRNPRDRGQPDVRLYSLRFLRRFLPEAGLRTSLPAGRTTGVNPSYCPAAGLRRKPRSDA